MAALFCPHMKFGMHCHKENLGDELRTFSMFFTLLQA